MCLKGTFNTIISRNGNELGERFHAQLPFDDLEGRHAETFDPHRWKFDNTRSLQSVARKIRTPLETPRHRWLRSVSSCGPSNFPHAVPRRADYGRIEPFLLQ